MLFNSVIFLWFFLIIYGLYLVFDHRWQNRMLLFASLWFYGAWDVQFLSLLIISIILDFYCGIKIHEAPTIPLKRRWLALSMAGNLGMLCSFKYFNFFIGSMGALLTSLGFDVHPWTLRIMLPVGISFYTFQTMSYTIDIYRGKMKPTYDMLDFSLFVSFFPQLVAGPIERAKNLLPQMEKPRILKVEQIKEGVFLIAFGLFQKIIIADHMAPLVNKMFAKGGAVGGWECLLGMYAFAMQLFGDFSGYSDIARGLGKMMGVELMLNFRLPYFSVRPSDFWMRWHISLTSWVRDYLFISLGANKRGNVRTHINLILTITAIGLWHGASWNFVLWGFYFGLLQSVHLIIQPFMGRLVCPRTDIQRNLVVLGSMVLNFHFFILGGMIFRGQTLAHSWAIFSSLWVGGWEINPEVIQMALLLFFICGPLLVLQIAQYRTNDLSILMKQSGVLRMVFYVTLIASVMYIYLFTANVKGGEEFIYFQF